MGWGGRREGPVRGLGSISRTTQQPSHNASHTRPSVLTKTSAAKRILTNEEFNGAAPSETLTKPAIGESEPKRPGQNRREMRSSKRANAMAGGHAPWIAESDRSNRIASMMEICTKRRTLFLTKFLRLFGQPLQNVAQNNKCLICKRYIRNRHCNVTHAAV